MLSHMYTPTDSIPSHHDCLYSKSACECEVIVSQITAWFMLHRIREAWVEDDDDHRFGGPVEVDETYMGGKRRNMSSAERRMPAQAGIGRGPGGKTAAVGIDDRDTSEVRAEAIPDTTGVTLQGFVREHTEEGVTVCCDEHKGYIGLQCDFDHEATNHSVAEYVDGMALMNGMESLWSMLKLAHKGPVPQYPPEALSAVCR